MPLTKRTLAIELAKIAVLAGSLTWSAAARAEDVTDARDAPAAAVSSFQPPSPDCRPVKPLVPFQARFMGITGTVRVAYTVDKDGRVEAISFDGSTAHPVLEYAVKRWLERCAYTPALSGGRAIAMRVVQRYIFKD